MPYFQSGKLSADKLSFEVPETDAAMHTAALEKLIAELRPLGCTFTLTSYSGKFVPAELLETLGIGLVKIDAHTMQHAPDDTGGSAKVKTTLRACRTFGIRTVGEFVERPETLAMLKMLGVDYAQGYGVANSRRLT